MDKEIGSLAELLTKTGKYKEAIKIIVQKSKEIMESDRACLIVKTKEGKLRIESGVPENDHGIGMELTPETGETVMKKALEGKSPVKKNVSDPELVYLGDFARVRGITSFFAIPLYCEGETLGILVLDFVRGREISAEKFSQIEPLAHFASLAIWLERHKKEVREKSNLSLLLMNALEVSHDMKNFLNPAKISVDFAIELIDELINSSENRKECLLAIKSNLEKTAENINKAANYLGQIKQGVMLAPKEPKFEKVDINEFLKSELITLSKCWPKIVFDDDLEDGNVIVEIDTGLISNCHNNVVANAIDANAGKFTVKTRFSDQEARIFYINDGDDIDRAVIDKIFNPFETTKDCGWGVGLVNVKYIIEKIHGGKIEVKNINDGVIFTVALPIKK